MNLDHFSEAELIDLNRRIVERLRFLQQARAHVSMLKFAIGERVAFDVDGITYRGVITRYNKKSVSLHTADGRRWNVSPSLLRVDDVVDSTATQSADVLRLPSK
ncbi:hypothetical protein NA78x_004659 [Anatilimnocola sp. NA78]|uniref:hypothetical protein n=1 Tax=Anatilimnocola sp. NA78 TaxID=3415683 RepID=UPI003CE4FF56